MRCHHTPALLAGEKSSMTAVSTTRRSCNMTTRLLKEVLREVRHEGSILAKYGTSIVQVDAQLVLISQLLLVKEAVSAHQSFRTLSVGVVEQCHD